MFKVTFPKKVVVKKQELILVLLEYDLLSFGLIP
jgi:hypothetical protein